MSEAMVVENTPRIEVIKNNTGFAARSVLEERIKKEEEELEQLKQNNVAESKDEGDDEEPTNPEEKSFKKRYGDLRRHSQKQQADLQKQIDELKSQLEKTTKEQIKLPKSEEELTQWANEYPDVAKIVETIAIKKAQEQAKELEERMKKIDQMQYDAMRQKAEAELMRLHPDFDKIREQEEFHNWVEEQPAWVQKVLYENETDAKSAARVIDLYKVEMGITKTKKRTSQEDDKEAARGFATGKGSGPDKGAESGYFKESQVERMSAKEYEKRQDEIVAAIRAGKFIYDVTGPAR